MAQKLGPIPTVGGMHPEDVKAAIRKQFGTIARFVEERSLPTTGVSDLLRGRPSRRVLAAIEEVIEAQERSDLTDELAHVCGEQTAGAPS